MITSWPRIKDARLAAMPISWVSDKGVSVARVRVDVPQPGVYVLAAQALIEQFHPHSLDDRAGLELSQVL